MSKNIDEQRLYPRRLLFLSLNCSDFLRDVSQKVKSKNISRGGVCITTQGNPFDVGSQVLLDFDLENEVIFVKGEVIWTSQITFDIFNNGIKFIEPKKKDIEKLLNFGVFSPMPRRIEH